METRSCIVWTKSIVSTRVPGPIELVSWGWRLISLTRFFSIEPVKVSGRGLKKFIFDSLSIRQRSHQRFDNLMSRRPVLDATFLFQ